MVLTIPWFVLPVWFLLGYENADIERYYLVPILVTVRVGGARRRLLPGTSCVARMAIRWSGPRGCRRAG